MVIRSVWRLKMFCVLSIVYCPYWSYDSKCLNVSLLYVFLYGYFRSSCVLLLYGDLNFNLM